jgi:hypothetical protein
MTQTPGTFVIWRLKIAQLAILPNVKARCWLTPRGEMEDSIPLIMPTGYK